MANKIISLATDYLLEPTLSQLTGSSVELDGTKASGEQYEARGLSNISIRPSADGSLSVIGMDHASGGIRTFRMDRVTRLHVVDGPTYMAHDLRPMLDVARRVVLEGLKEAQGSSEGGSDV